ncbi:DUF2851 family protein [Empedobacter brevis]|uniref:DUF2851 family protein n=1 Tax=Empedobacter brevis TaxID=247 RepID=UPI00289DE297|nr:DUF2851 family protein [Empedobacter brevis]
MKEIFLHYIWKLNQFSHQNLQTFHGDFIEIVKIGKLNHHAGPDFLEAEIIIGDKLWIGSVEMHVNSSDWNIHQHSDNLAYQNVILHVVWNHDCEVDILRQKNVQTLILQDFVKPEIVFNYQNIINTKLDKIYCEELLSSIDLGQFSFWFERILIERFEEKTKEILEILIKNQANWEETLFKSLAKNFGLKVNAEVFELWSNSFPFSVLQKIQFNPLKIEALFFGQAGFLEENHEEIYFKQLKNEYSFLKNKYQLQPISASLFRFSKMRPRGFPTIRLAQLASIYTKYLSLFSEITQFNKLKDFYRIFEKVELNSFWHTHYTFKNESKFQSKYLSKDKINNLLINSIIPIRYAFERQKEEVEIDFYLDLLNEIDAEKNTILDDFERIGFKNKTAKDSQQLIQLKKRYCSEKKCLNCAIGQQVLR